MELIFVVAWKVGLATSVRAYRSRAAGRVVPPSPWTVGVTAARSTLQIAMSTYLAAFALVTAAAEVAAAILIFLAIVFALATAPPVGASAAKVGCRIGVFQLLTDQAIAAIAAVVAAGVLLATVSASAVAAPARFNVRCTQTKSAEDPGAKTTEGDPARCRESN